MHPRPPILETKESEKIVHGPVMNAQINQAINGVDIFSMNPHEQVVDGFDWSPRWIDLQILQTIKNGQKIEPQLWKQLPPSNNIDGLAGLHNSARLWNIHIRSPFLRVEGYENVAASMIADQLALSRQDPLDDSVQGSTQTRLRKDCLNVAWEILESQTTQISIAS